MDPERINSWLQVLGMFGVIASLVFVGMQIRQTDVIASAEIQESAAVRNLATMELMADNIDVWQRGCVGAELTPAEQALMAKIYWAYVVNTFNGWRRLQRTDYRDASGQAQIDAFAANIHRYPGFRNLHESRLAWDELLGGSTRGATVERFYKLISNKVEDLSRLEPNPQYDGTWCGKS